MSKSINIYIPRILGKIKQNDIIEIFHNYGIGLITYIDMHYKINENKKPYYFAFMSIDLYDTDFANYIYYKILYENVYEFNYDNKTNNYWELKKHIPINMRKKNIEILEYSSTENISYDDAFDRETLEEEYENLQREIYSICC
uniref:RRM domain-containing protein n=1 Tax=viral metagenome TaxID=1070528 RepID=A0A6C0DBM5_9ZZZZ